MVFTIGFQISGWIFFIIVTVILGLWLRNHSSNRNAENTSRILHLMYWLCIIIPGFMVVVYPGLGELDNKLGLAPLSRQPLILIIGVLCTVIGVYLFITANIALRLQGRGANAFFLTKLLVVKNIYGRMRNPMSLGYYLGLVGFSLLAGSTYLLICALIAIIPSHIFYLKYFEEYELGLRMGQQYEEYKQKVPFIFPFTTSRKD